MSKYYKAEDVIRAIAEQLCWIARTEYGDNFTTEDWLEEAEDYVSDLPTIEVADLSEEAYEVGYTNGQMAERKRKIEVSEDCISREYMLETAQAWKNMYPDSDTAREALTMMINEIDTAPSVVPKNHIGKSTEMVGEWVVDTPQTNCGAKMKGADDDSKRD